jgi:hypothetical protein
MTRQKQQTGWLQQELRQVQQEVANWPEWMQNMRHTAYESCESGPTEVIVRETDDSRISQKVETSDQP